MRGVARTQLPALLNIRLSEFSIFKGVAVQFRRRKFGGEAGDDRWHRRPSLSRALRVAIFLGPIAASLLIATLLSRVLPRASGPLSAVLWVAIVACGSLVTLVIFERAARRLLPLAALLNVSLLFPDKAPARFAVARRTGSPRQLQEELAEARAAGHQDDAQRMQSVVELVLALSVHDKGTRGHSERVRVFTDLLAQELKIDPAGQARLRWAALLHDVGKIEVPTTLLNKPGTPDAAEWKVLHRHPEEGARMVAPLLPWLGEWGKAVAEHHERYDGTGYPFGLKAHEISLGARIVAVADTYEVMTAPRPYKRAMSIAAARAELTRVAGTQLDPGIVRAFLNISVGRLWRTIGVGAWIGQIPALGRLWTELARVGSWAGAGALTATTATVFALGGLGAPSPSASSLLASLGSPAHSTSQRGSHTPVVAPTTKPSATAVAPTAPSSAVSSSSAAPPTAKPTTKPTPTPNPTPTPKPTATPIPTPSPSPTPDPWSCAKCTNTKPSCTSYCTNNYLPFCTTYCDVSDNWSCTSHCFGNNNRSCITYCVGHNNTKCKTNCRLNGSFVATQPSLSPPLVGAPTPAGGIWRPDADPQNQVASRPLAISLAPAPRTEATPH